MDVQAGEEGGEREEGWKDRAVKRWEEGEMVGQGHGEECGKLERQRGIEGVRYRDGKYEKMEGRGR